MDMTKNVQLTAFTQAATTTIAPIEMLLLTLL
jgi:hypothetical protein